MSKTIFKDPEIQQRFETEGYVQIQLLEPEDIVELRRLFDHYFPNPAEGFFSSSYLNDLALKKEISAAIVAVLSQRFDRYFTNYRCFGSAFLSKTAGNRSEMPMHQDWSIVNEDHYVAVNIWTPLSDADKVNGSLEVLPRSHQFAKVRRSPTLPFFWSGYEGEMRKSLFPLEVKAGEAIVLNQSLVHYSPANQTPEVRPAITTGLLSAEAKMEFNYQTEPGEVDIYQMEDDFLLRWENFHEAIFKRPAFGTVVRHEQYQHPEIPEAEVLQFLRGIRSAEEQARGNQTGNESSSSPQPEKAGFMQRLKRIFS